MITTYIGVGSNIERHRHIEEAVRELSKLGGDLRLSTIYECHAVGFESEPFYNLVVEMKTSINLLSFSERLREIEIRWGRAIDAGKYEPRTLDLDIIFFGREVSESHPELPRSDIYKYAFVLQPLLELCPNYVVPKDGRTVKQIWQQLNLDTLMLPVPPWFYLNF
ncbi:2-amino-4-hydroxy-6-hydroxymethyldihydropteridine diphosphokinase [Vibrio caribbeanicus]|uniref:2-amino-4-hydroxy-6- hydroxymethyldihydropteridine diphosphokinase n=1 Tax=Vibrio caribbeanicus TaxID=701175 RepID=UPI002284E61C|nr:2-amino-4-hydroxy-6-hydroxymethyldihydropteridine diphosphokinase [Vibrio caribbeanicus]MCY9843785.1 2-amino-4-hydroxy-6-hydroxymethyldihydropteridine diphosphokinase [Vibrio caribbeanicus]